MDPGSAHCAGDQSVYYTTNMQAPAGTGYAQPYHAYFSQEPYVLGQHPQPVVMPVAAQPFIYIPPHQPSYAPQYIAVQQAAPVYYPQDMYVNCQAVVPQHLPSANVETASTCRPLSTSTPVPPDLSAGQPQMVSRDLHARNNVNQLAYCDENAIDDLSRITRNSDFVVADDTMCDSNDRWAEPTVERRGPVISAFKTRLCTQFIDRNYCEHGANCRFAHGPHELRSTPQTRMNNSKYKTRLCKNFLTYKDSSGSFYCPYGARCEFIHPNDKEFASLPAVVRNTVPPSLLSWSSSSSNNDVTPEVVGDYPGAAGITRSSVKQGSEKVLLKGRNIAGSMMCLASSGQQRDGVESGRHGMAPAASLSTLSKIRPRLPAAVPLKFARRRSRSQLNVKRWSSSEALV